MKKIIGEIINILQNTGLAETSTLGNKILFKERYNLGKKLDSYTKENGIKQCGMGYLTALQSLGFRIVKEDSHQEINNLLV